MGIIDEIRGYNGDLFRAMQKHSGIRKTVQSLYPDSAHFIYELLQNAEDAGAKNVHFDLLKDKLVFEHNGRPFTGDDIRSITDIGNSNKTDEQETIGRFGVGFKSVFDYTETPRIWSPSFSFEIRSLVLPYELEKNAELGKTTRFEFPFDSEKKPAEIAYAEIDACLNEISPTTLLFLRNIKRIEWKSDKDPRIELQREEISEHHIQIVKKADNNRACSEFLRFTAPVDGLRHQYVAIAFELEKVKTQKKPQKQKKGTMPQNYRIIPAQTGRVSIYFPARKEVSGLRFHIHAPFVPELSRASVKDTPVNKPLYEQIAKLSVDSLHIVRKLGLLKNEFLGVLPNSQDQLGLNYCCIRNGIQNAFKCCSLMPTLTRSHAPASSLVQGGAIYKRLFSNSDLGAFFPEKFEPLAWAISASPNNSNADRFLRDMNFLLLNSAKIFKSLKDNLDTSDYLTYYCTPETRKFQSWIYSKPADWYQSLYAILLKECENEIRWGYFKNLKLVRLQNDSFSLAKDCFFPGSDGLNDSLFPRVHHECVSSGKDKEEQANAKKFLTGIGIREIGESEYIKELLKSIYSQVQNSVTEEEHFKHIIRFASFLEKNSEQSNLFQSIKFLRSAEGDWESPDHLYIDSPYQATGLKAYYEQMPVSASAKRKAISKQYFYCKLNAEKLFNFFHQIGAATELIFQKIGCQENPKWSYLQTATGRKASPLNQDYIIPELENLFMTPSIELSRLVWNRMYETGETYLKAVYRHNYQQGAKEADSSIICLLKKACWVPQAGGSFVTPAKASFDSMPGGFPVDKDQDWLKAVNFGTECNDQSDNYDTEDSISSKIWKKVGFNSKEDLERAQDFSKLPVEEQKRFLSSFRKRSTTELPDREPTNPELRGSRVYEQAMRAGIRETELRMRAVDANMNEVKVETREYLRQYYTNDDGQMICQICQEELPFKLSNGEYYFESIQFLPDMKRQHYQNYLALCPNHAAMFRWANNDSDLITELFSEISANELPITLANRQIGVYFNTTHIADLKSVLKAEELVQADTNDNSGNNHNLVEAENETQEEI